MQYEVAVNLSSLDLVSTELGVTLDQAIDTFEEFLSDQDNSALLENCLGLVWQVAGTLKLIEVFGAALLARNMYALLDDSQKSGKPLNDKQLEALSASFFVLPRYLESVAARKSDSALMLLPQINELRLSHGREILFEHSLLGIKDQQFTSTSDFGVKPHADDQAASDAIKRLRHMYQVGLLGVIRESQVELHIRLMTRALQRLCGLIEPGPAQRFWLLASAVLDGFQERSLCINSTRRRLFGMLDKALRSLSVKPDERNTVPSVPGLEQELYYLLQISGAKAGTAAARFMAGAGIEPLPLRDIELQSQMRRMFGPGLDAMATVSRELRSELRNAMDILEILMQSGRTDADEIEPLQTILLQLAGVLKVLSLPTLATYLAAQAEAAGKLVGAGHTQAQQQLPGIADAILFIEHSFDKLDRNQLTASELEDLTPDRQMAISNSSQLETSRLLVFKESEAGISMSKRAITSYVESEYDIAHIYNVGSTLDTIRGAFQLLKMERITLVLKAAVRFVNDFTERTAAHGSGKAQELLETLADALISVEYYVLELSRQEHADDDLLTLAEESLAALGYKVQAKPAA
ncbi:MAG: hypothetical protein CMN85_16160 [Spongiibacteraceae bacterium]|nr:hypothetical protein [Spongiibacteraceae bacterium]